MRKLLSVLFSAVLISVFAAGCNGASGNVSSAPDVSSSSGASSDNQSVIESTPDEISASSDTSDVSSAVSSDTSVSSAPTPVHTHSWVTKTVEPDCTNGGYVLKTCECGASEKTNHTSALGHSWSSYTTETAATKTSTGIESRTCSRCNATDKRIIEKIPADISEFDTEVLRLVNEERQKAGLSPLTYYSEGQSAADTRASEIATQFSHTRPDGTSCFTVFNNLGINYMTAGENIAMGQTTPEEVMQSWMNSQGHRENILNGEFTHIIVGYNQAGNCWVQLFIGF